MSRLTIERTSARAVVNRIPIPTQIEIVKNKCMNDYDKVWKEILELERKGLIKSALKKVITLYDLAVREQNTPQIIKSILYREKYKSQLEEYGIENSIRALSKETETLKGPAQSLIHFIIGQSYNRYLQNNYWQFSNRTITPNFKPEALETWSIEHFITEINQHFELALRDAPTLKSVSIKDMNAITSTGKNTDILRPSLYDFMAFQILAYYSNPNSYLTEPIYKFYLDDEQAFATSGDFVKHTFITKDSTSHLYKSILLYQDVLDFRINQKDVAAIVDADLLRLQFALNNSTIPNKGELYKAALEKLALKYKSAEKVYPIILLAEANFYQQSNTHLDDEKPNLKKAHQILSEIIGNYKNSNIHNEAKNLQQNIERKTLHMDLENVYSQGENLLARISYSNLTKAYFRLYKIAPGEEYKIRNNRSEILDQFKNRPILQEWSQTLPAFDDFHQHQTEVKIDPLQFGQFLILSSSNKNFTKDKAETIANFFTISNLSYILTPNNKNHNLVVMNRISGAPISNAEVELYTQKYNSITRKNNLVKDQTTTSDSNGFVNIKINDRNSLIPKIILGEDVLFLQDRVYNQRDYTPEDRKSVNIFLDRAIYRPSQTIYFKAIAHNSDGFTQLPNLLPNENLKVILRDANYQEVEKLLLKTNEFGSINGSFTTPANGLLGIMTIEIVGYGGKRFRVEEYKRPKFEAEFLPVETEYALGENVVLSGKATAFAGNTIDGAKVVYRVERGVEYPYRKYRYYHRYRPQASMRIKTSETVTKADGTFEIDFELVPDPSTKQSSQPVFVYTIYADITDISGETRSVKTSIRASDLALALSVYAPTPIEKSELKDIKIGTTNLNGKFQAAKVDLKIYSLQAEQKLYRDRFWSFPDTVNFSKPVFEKLFPSYRYEEKKEIVQLPALKNVFSKSITSSVDGEVDISKLKLSVGFYKIVAKAKDKNGNLIEKDFAFEIKDKSVQKPAVPTALSIVMDKASYEPGQSAKTTIASSYGNANILSAIIRRDKTNTEKWLKLNLISNIKVEIDRKDLGNVSVFAFTIINNRFYSQSILIPVPWEEKNLSISYSSFRDKLLPGQEEEWTIKIEGSKKEKVAAELLAGMYDASLDQFASNDWTANYFPTLYANYQAQPGQNFRYQGGYNISSISTSPLPSVKKQYRQFEYFGYMNLLYNNLQMRSMNGIEATSARGAASRTNSRRMEKSAAPAMAMDEINVVEERSQSYDDMESDANTKKENKDILAQPSDKEGISGGKGDSPAIRKNLNETVFFFPDLHTDKDGNVLIKFKMNEALTKWKFMAFAHTKDLATAISTKEVVTQKELMVQPNAPRFFREGDKIRYSAKVSNLSEASMTGEATLKLFDALTMESINISFGNKQSSQAFTVNAGESEPLFWDLEIPFDQLGAVLHRVVVKAGKYSDGEESALPILTNRKLVTETMPLPMRAGQTKEFVFESMRNNKSTSLTNHQYTLEFTSNPAWYAVQSLPYLMEYPYECTEQIFNKYYANALASHVANSTPKIKQIFESWKGTDAMKSNLSKNQELKSALLEETPWVLDTQSEEQQRRNIALLFDLNKMSNEKAKLLKVLTERQLSNGGFSWFPGGRDSWYITQYLVEGIGHLQTLGIEMNDPELNQILQNAVRYIDDRLVEHYNNALKYNKDPGISGMSIHYLYARSFFMQYDFNSKTQKVLKHYQNKAKTQWVDQGIYYQGLLALASNRLEMKSVASEITASLKERALSHEELGKYWKYDRGYYWYQMPIETHSVMIEVFEEVADDADMVDELRLWLLKNKQTNAWETTKATSAAVYALLMSGDDWLKETKQVEIIYPNKQLNADLAKSQSEAQTGTGYFKHTWNEVNPNLSSLKVSNPNTVPAWGAAYWQYFEDLDKITTFEDTPLKLKKQVFLSAQGDRGETMSPVTESTKLKVGDKLKIRIELRVDRDMEFIHMKDMRASGFEPINVFSQYKWQGGLGYYESTKDASTNFFFDQLPKGTYVFEYPLRVVHAGDFSNGVTTIQSMYAPEFTSHSEGIRMKVGE